MEVEGRKALENDRRSAIDVEKLEGDSYGMRKGRMEKGFKYPKVEEVKARVGPAVSFVSFYQTLPQHPIKFYNISIISFFFLP